MALLAQLAVVAVVVMTALVLVVEVVGRVVELVILDHQDRVGQELADKEMRVAQTTQIHLMLAVAVGVLDRLALMVVRVEQVVMGALPLHLH